MYFYLYKIFRETKKKLIQKFESKFSGTGGRSEESG